MSLLFKKSLFNDGKRIKKLIRKTCYFKGFTTIELLVVIATLSLLSSILILYSRTSEKQLILFKEQARIIGILYRAKSLSIATFGQMNAPCAYGVHFTAPRNFLIFKDLGKDCEIDADKKYTDESELFESFELDSAVMFDNLSFTDIVFIPPDPSTLITPLQDEVLIVIKTLDGKGQVAVKITNFGQITATTNFGQIAVQ